MKTTGILKDLRSLSIKSRVLLPSPGKTRRRAFSTTCFVISTKVSPRPQFQVRQKGAMSVNV
jgi:hypothetical protein